MHTYVRTHNNRIQAQWYAYIKYCIFSLTHIHIYTCIEFSLCPHVLTQTNITSGTKGAVQRQLRQRKRVWSLVNCGGLETTGRR